MSAKAAAKPDDKKKKKKKQEEIKVPKDLAGLFLKEQLIATINIFRLKDAKKCDGFVDVKELDWMLRFIGGNPTQAEIDEWTGIVRNDEGKMDAIGFIQIAALELQTRKTEIDIVTAFHTFDEDLTGYVQDKEIRDKLMSTGEPLDQTSIDEFFKEASYSTLENGSLNYNEFIQQMTKDSDKAFGKKAKKLGLLEAPPKKGKKKKN